MMSKMCGTTGIRNNRIILIQNRLIFKNTEEIQNKLNLNCDIRSAYCDIRRSLRCDIRKESIV